jgi:hypothetical protein
MPPSLPNRDKRKKKSESKAAESSRYNVGYMQKRKEESWKRRKKKKDRKCRNRKTEISNPTQTKPKPESIPSKSDLLGAKPVPFHSPPTRKPRSLTNQRRKGTRQKEKPTKFQKRQPHRDISVRHEGRQSFPLSDTSFPCLRPFWSTAATKPICKTQFVSTSRRKSD